MVAMKITQDAFNNMPFDSGMWLKTFNVDNPVTPADSDILCTTTGDISINYTPTYTDLSEDVNNLHGRFKEFQHKNGATVQASFTALEATQEVLAMAFGTADINGNNVAPRTELYASDFKDRYWVGKTFGGKLVVAHLMNTISTGGVQFSTSKDGKGTIGVTLDAFASVTQQDVEPIEFYIIEADVPSISLEDYTASIRVGDTPFQLRATVVPSDATITWTTGDASIATVESKWYGAAITAVGAGRTAITGKITVSGVDYTATCLVSVDAGA